MGQIAAHFRIFKLLRKPVEYLEKKIRYSASKPSILCFDGQAIVGGRPFPKLWGYTKSPIQNVRFCYKYFSVILS